MSASLLGASRATRSPGRDAARLQRGRAAADLVGVLGEAPVPFPVLGQVVQGNLVGMALQGAL